MPVFQCALSDKGNGGVVRNLVGILPGFCLLGQTFNHIEEFRIVVAYLSDNDEVCQFRIGAFLFPIQIRCQIGEQLLRGNLFLVREVFDVFTKRIMECLQLLKNTLFKRHLLLGTSVPWLLWIVMQ